MLVCFLHVFAFELVQSFGAGEKHRHKRHRAMILWHSAVIVTAIWARYSVLQIIPMSVLPDAESLNTRMWKIDLRDLPRGKMYKEELIEAR